MTRMARRMQPGEGPGKNIPNSQSHTEARPRCPREGSEAAAQESGGGAGPGVWACRGLRLGLWVEFNPEGPCIGAKLKSSPGDMLCDLEPVMSPSPFPFPELQGY